MKSFKLIGYDDHGERVEIDLVSKCSWCRFEKSTEVCDSCNKTGFILDSNGQILIDFIKKYIGDIK